MKQLGRVYINDDFQKRLPATVVNDGLDDVLRRGQNEYFLDKYGKLPAQSRLSYYSGLLGIVNVAVEEFIGAHGFTAMGLHDLPVKEEDGLTSGLWMTEVEDAYLSIWKHHEVVWYQLVAKDADAADALVADLRTRVDSKFRRKVIRLDEKPTILPLRAVRQAKVWRDLKPTIGPAVAIRIEKVLLPFFDKIEVFRKAGVEPRLGVLLHGEPGTGKTYLMRTLIREFYGKATIAHIAADQFAGRSSGALREVFSFLERFVPLVIILEDIELLARDRAEVPGGFTQTLLEIMDGAAKPLDRVVIIATTNMLDKIDPAFKRPGRFDEQLEMKAPPPAIALEVLSGYFGKANMVIHPDKLKDVAESRLSYAQLRFVATELIRRAILSGVTKIEATREELREACVLSKIGTQKKLSVVGFNQGLPALDFDD